MMEQILASYHHAYGLDYTALRYFNVVGADSQARHGQRANATHIIARVLESLRDDAEFTLNGDDYDTPDGTCVRDHVHVEDVANAHVMAVFPEMQGGVYNVGEEHGASNKEIISMAESVTGRRLQVRVGPRREGDPARLVANTERIRSQGWQPQYLLEEMIEHAWAWYNC
jgi:UDP-glucose 4-epimerase